MAKPLRSCLFFLLILFVLFLGSIVFLELGSRWYIMSTPSSSAPEILVCHLDYYPINEEKILILDQLTQKHANGEQIQDHELESASILAPQADMPSLNGIVCNGMIIVSSRLEGPARLYVIRHELEHVFQIAGLEPDCEDTELCATWAAALDYPLGFVSAIISSLKEAYRLSPSVWEFLFSSWYVFKVYLLP